MDWNNAIQSSKGKQIKIEKVSENEFLIDLKKGETIVLTSNGEITKTVVKPVEQNKSELNQYGVKKGMNLKEIMEYRSPEYGY